jgi:hypothetical protein
VALLLITLAAAPGVSAQATDEPPASDPSPAHSPTADATGSAFPFSADPVPVEPGTYRIPRSAWSVADLTFTFPEGWTVQYGHVFAGNPDEDDEFGFYPVVVDTIWADACAGSDSGDPIVVGPNVDDLTAALLQQPGPLASGPVATTVGGYPATRIDLTVPEGFALDACNAAGIGLQIWYSPAADKNFVLAADGSASVYILDVDGERQVFLAQHGDKTSDEDLAELQAVLETIHIEQDPMPQPSVAVPSSPVEMDASPEPGAPPVDASPVAETVHGWPGTRSEPAGLYSWALPARGRSWMHKVPATWTGAAPNSVELTFYAAKPLDLLEIMGHAARYSPDVRTEMRLLDVEGTMVAILIDSFPDTDPALVAEARAVVESIVIEPRDSGHRLVFRLLEGWDSG